MKRFADAYKRNNNSGIGFNQIVAKAFRQAETLSSEIVDAIEHKQFEQRCIKSEEVIRLMVELHAIFSTEEPKGIDRAMQKYCLGNINLLSKINLKNDKDLAITLKQSFLEVGNMWEDNRNSSENTDTPYQGNV
jgi:flagellin-specific chaperone FliS